MTRLSKHELETLRTILRTGGRVELTNDRIVDRWAGRYIIKVRSTTVARLFRRGLVREWSTGACPRSGGVRDIEVTPDGCRAFSAADDSVSEPARD